MLRFVVALMHGGANEVEEDRERGVVTFAIASEVVSEAVEERLR